MNLLRHAVAALVFVALVVAVFFTATNDLVEGYNITDDILEKQTLPGETTNQTLIAHLNDLDFLNGIEEITNGIIEVTVADSFFDIFGGLKLAGVGILKTIAGLATIPFDLLNIIEAFYPWLPTNLLKLLFTLVIISIAFILVSAYTGRDV